jgi:hypothetical protein
VRAPLLGLSIGPFFFSESTITGVVYLDLLEQYVFPQIETLEQETVSRVNLEVCYLRCVKLIILHCIMCIFIHIHAVETQQLTDGISM